MGTYSQPCTPAITVSSGPSWAPASSTTGTSSPARSRVRRVTVVGMSELTFGVGGGRARVGGLGQEDRLSAAAATRSRAASPPRRPASWRLAGRPGDGTGIAMAGWPVRLYGPVNRPSPLSSPVPNGGSCAGATKPTVGPASASRPAMLALTAAISSSRRASAAAYCSWVTVAPSSRSARVPSA